MEAKIQNKIKIKTRVNINFWTTTKINRCEFLFSGMRNKPKNCDSINVII